MAVTYRQAEIYRPLVEAVFAEAGIPVYLDDGPSLAERPLGRRILALLDLVDSPLPRRDVMAFLTDGRMPKETRERFGGAPVRPLGFGLPPRRCRRGPRPVAQPDRTSCATREAAAAAEEGAPGVARAPRRRLRLAARASSSDSPPTSRPTRSGPAGAEALAWLRRLLETYVLRRRGRARLPRPARPARRARARGRAARGSSTSCAPR